MQRRPKVQVEQWPAELVLRERLESGGHRLAVERSHQYLAVQLLHQLTLDAVAEEDEPGAPHCLPAYRDNHSGFMVFIALCSHVAYNDSYTVRGPAPVSHPPHSFTATSPERPKPAPLSPAVV